VGAGPVRPAWLLIADSLARAAVFATIPLAAAWGGLTDVQIYLVAAVYGLLKMTSLAGFPPPTPTCVPRRGCTACPTTRPRWWGAPSGGTPGAATPPTCCGVPLPR
jgi:hypothetical protein